MLRYVVRETEDGAVSCACCADNMPHDWIAGFTDLPAVERNFREVFFSAPDAEADPDVLAVGVGFDDLCARIASGAQDIDLADFAARLSLPEGWDWEDVRALPLSTSEVGAAIRAGLR